MTTAEGIGRRIKTAREFAEMTQNELGDKLGIGANAISKIETGRSMLTLEHLFALPAILDRPLSYFLNIPTTNLEPDEETLLSLFRQLPPASRSRRLALLAVSSLLEALNQIQVEDGLTNEL